MPKWTPDFDVAFLSCEHGGSAIPAKFKPLFASWQGRLKTHFGLDKGALAVAKHLEKALGWPLLASTTSRLLIDLNRPLGHETLFSSRTNALPEEKKAKIIETYHTPYWAQMEQTISSQLAKHRRVLHLSVHSFTPVMRGVRRDCDLGLLFDPKSKLEQAFCIAWQKELAKVSAGRYRVRLNYPYSGSSPALTTSLRSRFGWDDYAGVEIEINQKFARKPQDLRAVMLVLAASLRFLAV